ncbi:MAG: peptide chain release factor 1 [Limisphaerales bacterium]
MLELLEKIENKYKELTELLYDPVVLGEPSRLQKIARERAGLEETVQAAARYRQVLSQIEEGEKLKNAADRELAEMAKAELEELKPKKERLEEELKLLLAPRDPNDTKNVIVEIRAGTGGEEAALFASELYRMYLRYAERQGWKVELLSSHPTGLGGYKEVVFLIEGKGAFGKLKHESGVHRVQRVPATEGSGRIHTSAASVAVLPEAEDVDVQINPSDLRIDVFRAGGPGGQGVNTTDSAVRIIHIPTGLVVSCQDERSQIKNRAKAMKVLQTRLFDRAVTEQKEKIDTVRRSMVGSGDRSEKIRTYNFPQNRMTDHRIGLTLHSLDSILEGGIDAIVEALRQKEQEERLKNSKI